MSDIGNKKIFSTNLTYYMGINRVTRYKLSEDLKIKYSTLCEWISGKKYPRIDNIEKLANYFGVPKSALIEKREVLTDNASDSPYRVTEKLVQIRNYYKLTSAQFAQIAGTSERRVLCWESGEENPTLNRIEAICVFFKLNLSDLLDGDKELDFENAVKPNLVRVLSEKEAAVLYYLEQLNTEGQQITIDYIDTLISSGKYKKSDTNGLDSEGA